MYDHMICFVQNITLGELIRKLKEFPEDTLVGGDTRIYTTKPKPKPKLSEEERNALNCEKDGLRKRRWKLESHTDYMNGPDMCFTTAFMKSQRKKITYCTVMEGDHLARLAKIKEKLGCAWLETNDKGQMTVVHLESYEQTQQRLLDEYKHIEKRLKEIDEALR